MGIGVEEGVRNTFQGKLLSYEEVNTTTLELLVTKSVQQELSKLSQLLSIPPRWLGIEQSPSRWMICSQKSNTVRRLHLQISE